MRQMTSILALVAALGASFPPGPGFAQQVSPDLASRLRAAVAQAEPPTAPAASGLSQETFSTSELDNLVAPIALYPDALLAQVFVAATYPDQIAQAGQIISRAPNMSDSDLSDAISGQQWDQSVLVLLSGFPSIISRMAGDMDWTRNLGTAVLNQDPAVLAAVQHMRSEAMAEGNLVSNKAQVVSKGNGGITIRTADPNVVYVPQYDADSIYTTRNVAYGGPEPVAAVEPGVNPFVAGAIGFGAGILAANLFRDATHHNDNSGPPPPPGPWAGYWHRDDVFNWRHGTFYPHPTPGGPAWTPPPPPPGHGPAPVPPQPVAVGNGPGAGEGGRHEPSQAAGQAGQHPVPVSAGQAKPQPRQERPGDRRAATQEQAEQQRAAQERAAQQRAEQQRAEQQRAKPAGQEHAEQQRASQQRTADAHHPADARKLPPICKTHPDEPECR